MKTPNALIAEDEPLLSQALVAELALAWPELQVLACVGDGQAALDQALEQQPDVLFFDIRMPGLSGLEAAAELAERWDGPKPFPALVFVTAYDDYAVQAFENHAVDYLLKPVQAPRLRKTVSKLQTLLSQRRATALPLQQTLDQLRQLLAEPMAAPAPARQYLTVSQGNQLRMVPMSEVLYFEAADKYVRVLTDAHEYLIRTPLKQLMPQLDMQVFWQIHRGTVVRSAAIDSLSRDEQGRLSLRLRGRSELLSVSRLYAHQFRAM